MRPLQFVYFGQMPSGKNGIKITRTGRRYPSKRFAMWKADALHQIGHALQPFTGPCWIDIDYYPGDRIRRDAPGIQDALFHVLEEAGIVLDDAQFKAVVYRERELTRKAPRCEVTIYPQEDLCQQETNSQ